jgi:hypothetical protein
MTKREIALYMQEIGFMQDTVDVQAAIRYVLRKNPADTVDSAPEALVTA